METIEKLIIYLIFIFLFFLITSQFMLYYKDLFYFWNKFHLYEGVMGTFILFFS